MPKKKKPHFHFSTSDFLRKEVGSWVSFSVTGKPTPQYRDRQSRSGNRYNPSKDLQNHFREVVRDAHINKFGTTMEMFGREVPLHIKLQYYLPPKSSEAIIITEADLDNLTKFTLDALSGVVYVNDGQVCGIDCSKNLPLRWVRVT